MGSEGPNGFVVFITSRDIFIKFQELRFLNSTKQEFPKKQIKKCETKENDNSQRFSPILITQDGIFGSVTLEVSTYKITYFC